MVESNRQGIVGNRSGDSVPALSHSRVRVATNVTTNFERLIPSDARFDAIVIDGLDRPAAAVNRDQLGRLWRCAGL
jgi:hypothetical protein